jgi:autophagy-related protein 2
VNIQYAVEEWTADIRNRQLGNVLGSYGPISSFTQIAQGVRDLFYIPLAEFRKEDGRIVKGIQRGASSFGISTATAAIDATQMVASTIQGVAELVFDIVTPDYTYERHRRYMALQRVRVPGDIREGLHMAYDTVREGVRDTAQCIHNATQEDRAAGAHWGFRGLLRQATPTAIRPIVIASQATIQVLGGLKSQLRPEDHREQLEKYKQTSK